MCSVCMIGGVHAYNRRRLWHECSMACVLDHMGRVLLHGETLCVLGSGGISARHGCM